MSKPIVHYTWVGKVEVGKGTRVWAVDHPTEGRGLMYTSIVQSTNGPQFETVNTVYRPFELPEVKGLPAELSKPIVSIPTYDF